MSQQDANKPASNTYRLFFPELGWLVTMDKSELYPKQVIEFVGYQFDLKEGKVRPTLELWQTLIAKIKKLLSRPT